MTVKPANNLKSRPGRPAIATVAVWVTVTCAMAAVLAMLLAHAPHRLRLIGLFAGLQGGLCGWTASLAAFRLRMRFPLTAMLGSAAFAAGSVALTTTLWWQAHAARLTAGYRPPPGAAMAAAILDQANRSPDQATQRELEAYRQALAAAGATPPDTDFSAYLRHRSSAVTDSRMAGPWLFGLELLLAGVLGGWLARSSAGRAFCPTCGDWRLPVRTQEFSGDAAERVASLAGLPSGPWPRAVVTFNHCQCADRPPEALILLDGAEQTESLQVRSTDAETGVWSEERLGELNRQIDAAQGLR